MLFPSKDVSDISSRLFFTISIFKICFISSLFILFFHLQPYMQVPPFPFLFAHYNRYFLFYNGFVVTYLFLSQLTCFLILFFLIRLFDSSCIYLVPLPKYFFPLTANINFETIFHNQIVIIYMLYFIKTYNIRLLYSDKIIL